MTVTLAHPFCFQSQSAGNAKYHLGINNSAQPGKFWHQSMPFLALAYSSEGALLVPSAWATSWFVCSPHLGFI